MKKTNNQPLTNIACLSGDGGGVGLKYMLAFDALELAVRGKNGKEKGFIYIDRENALELILGIISQSPEYWNLRYKVKKGLAVKDQDAVF